ALARERTGDLEGAARAWASLGSRGAEMRARALMAQRDTTLRPAVRRDLLALLESRPGTADARTAVELLDAGYAPLAPAEELLVARSATRSGPLARAATGYARAFAGGTGTAADRFDQGTTLYRLNRDREAAAAFARLSPAGARGPLAAAAAYQRGRALVAAGDVPAARRQLRDVLSRFPRDSSAGLALMLLADLATDEGRDADARAAYRQAVPLLPRGARASAARFRAALLAHVLGRPREAAAEWDSLASLDPRGEEANAATYWSGRAWKAAGDSARARERWRAVLARDPLSYYAALAARRLGEAPWAPAGGGDPEVAAAAQRVMERGQLLDALGMDAEERLEYDALAAAAARARDAARLLDVATAFRANGEASRGIATALRAIDAGAARDARLYRLLYPLGHQKALEADAKSASLDAALMAALIRQESRWSPRATSAAGARGLMQVMPGVGASVARSLGITPWDPVLLYEPEVNLAIGARHLRAYIAQYQHLERALAAYNAGQSRVARWGRKGGVEDPELFVERIPFVETRDYVRIVLRTAELYRALYEW
ncbi:MAG TPA: lytic transglycosylase domain-containing protein, partial [Gemmatimonadaceae bacterium]|nr:lytic transglycosylase domain-containing protein [Gemmatimonadaceae bacterium]